MYQLGTAILNTLCSDDVTYPDHVVLLHVGNGQLEYQRATSRYHGTLSSKAFCNWFLLNSIATILNMERS